ARVEGTQPDSWEDPSVAQVWFRGSDYIVPRPDAGIFTLGSSPRDPERMRQLDHLADRVHEVTQGRILTVREVTGLLGLAHQTHIRDVALTGRVHIRWNASRIWTIPVDRPEIDTEDARRELARRHLHWFGPTTVARLARWTGVEARDAAQTWASIESELEPVDIDGVEGGPRFVLKADVDALLAAEPITGVRLLPYDDAYTKLDRELLVHDPKLRARVLPLVGQSTLGYTPGAILVDGEIVGAWQRQQRKVTVHPWSTPSPAVRDAVEAEALAFPIAGSSKASVTWD
ncbi:MAG: winged helix DNA-binding domain-containing protein, partial [Chloroflexi bacterium]|nr:winged helix DNA-binding domain-containing protein [Chloroflexota bacterium]